jgi:hypothetical protein
MTVYKFRLLKSEHTFGSPVLVVGEDGSAFFVMLTEELLDMFAGKSVFYGECVDDHRGWVVDHVVDDPGWLMPTDEQLDDKQLDEDPDFAWFRMDS